MQTFRFLFIITLIVYFFLFSKEGFAQSEIIAWQTTSNDEKAAKSSIHKYDAQGRLMSVEEPMKDLKTNYIYDNQARLTRLDIYTTEGLVKVSYSYAKEPTTTISHPVWGEQKRVSYKDERGKVTEEKIYHNQQLVRRVLYSYTSFDSLFGREVVDFFEPTKDGKITPYLSFIFSGNKPIQNPIPKKYITYFDENTKKKIRQVVFTNDKKALEETFFTYFKVGKNRGFIQKSHYFNYETGEQKLIWYDYDEKTNLPTFVRTEKRQKENITSYASQEFIYQEGRLWQIISQNFDSPVALKDLKTKAPNSLFTKKVTIFKDGKMIRERHYEGNTLTKTIDYQYAKT